MTIDREMLTLPRLLLIAITIAVAGIFIFGAATSAAAFDIYNPDWEGGTDLRSVADETNTEWNVLTNTNSYQNADDESLAVIVSADEPYEEDAIDDVTTFLENGGTVLLADRHPNTANTLLEGVGATARVDGAILRDERNYYQSPALPVATNVVEHTYTTDVESLTLNYGTSIESNDATVLVNSSEYAYLDVNNNQELDDNETMQAQPVAVTEEVNNGSIILVSDGSAFINIMQAQPGNQAFLTNIFTQHDTVLFDRTHHTSPPPLQALLLTLQDSPLLQIGVGAIAIGSVVGWLRGWQLPRQLKRRS